MATVAAVINTNKVVTTNEFAAAAARGSGRQQQHQRAPGDRGRNGGDADHRRAHHGNTASITEPGEMVTTETVTVDVVRLLGAVGHLYQLDQDDRDHADQRDHRRSDRCIQRNVENLAPNADES